MTSDSIRLICHRNLGIGSDGILLGPINDPPVKFALKIFINEKMEVNGQTIKFCAATIGNPHCVIYPEMFGQGLKPELKIEDLMMSFFVCLDLDYKCSSTEIFFASSLVSER